MTSTNVWDRNSSFSIHETDHETVELKRFRGDIQLLGDRQHEIQRTVVIVDVETTGLDPETAEIIEFAWIQLRCDGNGLYTAVLASGSHYSQPKERITPEITAIT